MANIESASPANDRCIFCRIARGETPASVVYEDAATLAFLDHRPLFPGHVLVIPKAHVETLADLPPDLIAPLFATVQLVGRAVEQGLGADGSFDAINNRVSQSVPHLHVHVVPRRKQDGLFARGMVWKRQPYKDEAAMRAAQQAIRDAIAAQRSSAEGRNG